MNNWEFFVSLLKMHQKYFVPPKVMILEERNDYLEKYHDAWGYYEPEERVMRILKEFDCIPVRIHEYGHWINACVYFVLEIIWEFFWWGLGLRSIFKKRGGKIRK